MKEQTADSKEEDKFITEVSPSKFYGRQDSDREDDEFDDQEVYIESKKQPEVIHEKKNV